MRPCDEFHEASELGLEGRHIRDTRPLQPDAQVCFQVLHRATAQVVLLVRSDDVVSPVSSDLTEILEDLVGAVPSCSQTQVDA